MNEDTFVRVHRQLENYRSISSDFFGFVLLNKKLFLKEKKSCKLSGNIYRSGEKNKFFWQLSVTFERADLEQMDDDEKKAKLSFLAPLKLCDDDFQA